MHGSHGRSSDETYRPGPPLTPLPETLEELLQRLGEAFLWVQLAEHGLAPTAEMLESARGGNNLEIAHRWLNHFAAEVEDLRGLARYASSAEDDAAVLAIWLTSLIQEPTGNCVQLLFGSPLSYLHHQLAAAMDEGNAPGSLAAFLRLLVQLPTSVHE